MPRLSPDLFESLSQTPSAPPSWTGPVLLALDASSPSDAAINWSAQLAESVGVEVVVLSVLSRTSPTDDAPVGPDQLTARLDQCRRKLNAILIRVLGRNPGWRIETATGPTAAAISHAAVAHRAAMIVLGTAPMGLWKRLVGASTRTDILSGTTIPILAIPAGARMRPSRAVVATDFGAGSTRAARFAISLLRGKGTVYLLHILATGADPIQTRLRLTALVEDLAAGPALAIEPVVLAGGIIESINRFAECAMADLVALGIYGQARSSDRLWATGPTQLLRDASYPVLVMPPLRVNVGESLTQVPRNPTIDLPLPRQAAPIESGTMVLYERAGRLTAGA